MSTHVLRRWTRWTRLTFVGWVLGFLLVLALIGVTGLVGLGDVQFTVGLGMGLGVGLLQSRAAAELIGRGRTWTLASGLGMAAPFLASDVARLVRPETGFSLALNVVLGGALVGALQATLLRGHLRAPWLWLPASLLGWSTAASTVFFNERFLPRIPGLAGALLYVAVLFLGGLAMGVIGGVAMSRLAPPPR